MEIKPRSLQQQTLFFILAPIFLLLVCLSVTGYIFVRTVLLNQWGETAITKLQRTAHQIDMRLSKPKDLLLLLHSRKGDDVNREILPYILQEIKNITGVVGAKIEWKANFFAHNANSSKHESMMGRMRIYQLERLTVSSPTYSSKENSRIISLESELKDKDGNSIGRIEIVISFDNLINEIIKTSWWKTNKAYFIDDSGNVLADTSTESSLDRISPLTTFGSADLLESDTLKAMEDNLFGTVFGPGSPPKEISGFYRLSEAPWTLVVIAPGGKILQPVLRFKLFYILSLTFGILMILLIVRVTTGRLTGKIRQLSAAANSLARGNFGPPLKVTSNDELGELTNDFNKMTNQLKHRLLLKETMSVAREVQQNLLPHAPVSLEKIEAYGLTLYCDETGGDYFDILKFPNNNQKIGLVVGDVVGHGVGAALLMTTVRALLRSRVIQPGDLGEIMNHVNSLLCQDTMKTGNFVTLFYLEVDQRRNTLNWVRAGHDPAIVYCPASADFSELKGRGVALGVDETYQYEYNEQATGQETQLVLIGSDGAWDVENQDGDRFSKERMKEILADNCSSHPDEILQTIVQTINTFRGMVPQSDDIPLVLVKIG